MATNSNFSSKEYDISDGLSMSIFFSRVFTSLLFEADILPPLSKHTPITDESEKPIDDRKIVQTDVYVIYNCEFIILYYIYTLDVIGVITKYH